jgi:hypothetical protein
LALLLGGVLQAAESATTGESSMPAVAMLDPELQARVALHWIQERGHRHSYARRASMLFRDVEKIRFHSAPYTPLVAEAS